MEVVVVGHVDHGKSSLLGRLLADTGSLATDRLAALQAVADEAGKPFEHAHLLDALADERGQGITIDAARAFFRTAKRPYLFLDAPGHLDFLKNMITGASRADAALLVVDAVAGVAPTTRRHAHVLSLLGISQVIVVVNKMDAVGYARSSFEAVASELDASLTSLGIRPVAVLPASAREGANVQAAHPSLMWFEGPSLLEALDGLNDPRRDDLAPFRLPIQGVYKLAGEEPVRRVLVGNVTQGTVRPGDAVVLYPSGRRTHVARIEAFGRGEAPTQAAAGAATGLCMGEEIYARRGEILARADEPGPLVGTRLRGTLLWLHRHPLVLGEEITLRVGTERVTAEVEALDRVLDGSTLAMRPGASQVERHEVADVVLRARRPVAVDATPGCATSRFVLVRALDTVAGGQIRDVLSDDNAALRANAFQRNLRWERGQVGADERARRFGQRAYMVLISAAAGDARRKDVARALEARLFADGRAVYYLGLGSVVHGLDADLPRDRSPAAQREHFRRLGEVAHLMLEAGLVLIVTADAVGEAELAPLRAVLPQNCWELVWLGSGSPPSADVGLHLGQGAVGSLVDLIAAHLAQRGTWEGGAPR